MKIAVSSKGSSLDSTVDPRFGRTDGFALYDSDTGGITYLDNATNRDRSQGTGIRSAQLIIDAGANSLITGKMGPKAARLLERSNVNVYICNKGTVQEAVQSLEQNQLPELSQDDVQPGPGKMGGRGIGGSGRGRGLA